MTHSEEVDSQATGQTVKDRYKDSYSDTTYTSRSHRELNDKTVANKSCYSLFIQGFISCIPYVMQKVF